MATEIRNDSLSMLLRGERRPFGSEINFKGSLARELKEVHEAMRYSADRKEAFVFENEISGLWTWTFSFPEVEASPYKSGVYWRVTREGDVYEVRWKEELAQTIEKQKAELAADPRMEALNDCAERLDEIGYFDGREHAKEILAGEVYPGEMWAGIVTNSFIALCNFSDMPGAMHLHRTDKALDIRSYLERQEKGRRRYEGTPAPVRAVASKALERAKENDAHAKMVQDWKKARTAWKRGGREGKAPIKPYVRVGVWEDRGKIKKETDMNFQADYLAAVEPLLALRDRIRVGIRKADEPLILESQNTIIVLAPLLPQKFLGYASLVLS